MAESECARRVAQLLDIEGRGLMTRNALLQTLYVMPREPLPETTCVSIGDPSRFFEWLDVGDDHHASAALFVSPAEAWPAIEAFVEHGTLGAGVKWLDTRVLPPEANR